ncbi:MAG: Na+/H+ antiporter subunit E, partial [Pseudomonadota bacterium]
RGVAAFAGFFLVRSAQGGLQVARLALRPRLRLEPELLTLPTTLPPGPLRILLVNTLNLLPGTVATRIDGDLLHLHVLDARLPIADEVRRVEDRIAALLEPAP